MPASGIPPVTAREPQTGNPDAAQDLYGLGVRVGFYLQALGMVLYNYGDKENYGKGIKVASGSMTVSVLASWFVFAYRGLFSPSEAIIVLLILIGLLFPAKTTLLNPRTIVGETMGLITLLVVELGTCSALLWMFARLVDTLPALETDNVVFFFAKVAIDGWFRYLALVYCVIDAVTSISFAYKVTRVIAKSWVYKAEDYQYQAIGTPASTTTSVSDRTQMEATPVTPQAGELGNRDEQEPTRDGGLESKFESIINWKDMDGEIRLIGWLTWILVIMAVELTVQWNHLSPSTNLQAPGQLIPFVTGIIIFIDSCFVAGNQLLPQYVRLFFKSISGIMDCINAGLYWLNPAKWCTKLRQSEFTIAITECASNSFFRLVRKVRSKRNHQKSHSDA